MLNLESIDKAYLSYGFTDLRKSIDGLGLEVQNVLKLDLFEKALFVFCNRQQNRIKILMKVSSYTTIKSNTIN